MHEAPGAPIYYVSEGHGEPVVFVHAFPLDGRMWTPQRLHFRDKARVIVPDLRGFGRSIHGKLSRSIDDHADDLAAMLDAMKLERAAFVGLSMGGYVSLALWRRHRARISRLCLADTRAGADSAEGKSSRDKSVATVRLEGLEVLVDALLPKLLAPATPRMITDHVREIAYEQAADSVIHALEAMRDRPDSSALLASVDVPTSVLVGEHDTLTPPEESRTLCAAIAGATLTVLPSAGHLSNLEAPAAFNAAIESWLARTA